MRRLLLNIATAVLTFTLSVGASYAVNVAGDAIVNAIPIDDAPCWEETMRFYGLDTEGRSFCLGGEIYKIPNCP